MWKRTTAAFLAALVATSSLALEQLAQEDNAGLKRIPFANLIDGWQLIDNRRLVLNSSPQKNYLLTLKRDCYGLRFARNIGFSTSNNTIYAGFDYVTVDGGQRCAIDQIQRVTRDDIRYLKSEA